MGMNRLGVPIINAFRLIAAAGCSLIVVTPALAHHGGGTFDNTKTIDLTGTLTRLELINPHSWIYFDAMGPDGKVHAYRCEMRAATVLRRSGWKRDVKPGQRSDRASPIARTRTCYLNTTCCRTAAARLARQFAKAPVVAKLELRGTDGEPNISVIGAEHW